MDSISLPQLEQAINYWRNISPSIGEESRLCPEAAALATPYALMILSHRHDIAVAELNEKAQAALAGWAASGARAPSNP
ncbi:MAG: DUF3717 domain-containing protein [Achromobacter sp.]